MTNQSKELHFVKDAHVGESGSGEERHLSRAVDGDQLHFVKDAKAKIVDTELEGHPPSAGDCEGLYFVKDGSRWSDTANEIVFGPPVQRTLTFASRKPSRGFGR
jgi:hypothetical protein